MDSRLVIIYIEFMLTLLQYSHTITASLNIFPVIPTSNKMTSITIAIKGVG